MTRAVMGMGVSEHGRPGETEHQGRICWAVEKAGEAHGLSPPEIQTLQAIAVGDRTWTDLAYLGLAGLNGTTLSGLIASRWVEEFHLNDGPVVTLSAWAAEVLSLDQEEHWEFHSSIAEQEDSHGEKTRMRVREPHEVPRWETRPPPREPGTPKPRTVPLKLPFLFHLSRLPDDVIKGMLARSVPDPVSEAIEREEFLMEQSRLEDGRLDVDPESGAVREIPVVLFGAKIPREKPRKRRGKRKRRPKSD